MGLIGKISRLSFSDLRLLMGTVVALTAVKLGLSLLPFHNLRRLIRKVSKSGMPETGPDRRLVKKVTWALNVVSVRMPIFRNCLNRALAAQVLLGRRGQQVDLRIGVRHDSEGEFHAHAWVESEGRIVLGVVDELADLTPLPPLNLHDISS